MLTGCLSWRGVKYLPNIGMLSIAPPTTSSGRYSVLQRVLDRLVALGRTIILGLGVPPVDDHTAADGDAIGLAAQRFAVYRSEVGLDACGPARSMEIAARRRDLHMAWLRGGGEHRIQF